MCALRTVGAAGMHICIVYFHLPGIYTLLVCGGDFFSVLLKREKNAGAIILLHSIFTRKWNFIHALMLLYSVQLRLLCDQEKRVSQIFFIFPIVH